MVSRMRAHRPVVSDLPDDFGERIEEFRVAGGLTVRSLARLLGVSPHRVREWRGGVAPASRHLYLLLMIAERMGLRDVLMRPDDDLPAEVERQIAAGRGDYRPPQGSPRPLRVREREHHPWARPWRPSLAAPMRCPGPAAPAETEAVLLAGAVHTKEGDNRRVERPRR